MFSMVLISVHNMLSVLDTIEEMTLKMKKSGRNNRLGKTKREVSFNQKALEKGSFSLGL